MTNRVVTSIAALILFSACALPAQTSKASSASETVKLLPGLDTRLIDTTADPCVDFFQYACGNFNKLYPIPSDRSSYGTGAMIFEYTENVLQVMLDKAAAAGSGRSPNEQKIGDYYASCMDTDTVESKGLKPLQPDLDRIAALTSKSELPELLAHFQIVNVNAFLNFGEQQDFKDARKQIAVLDQGGIGLPERDYYFRTGDVPEKTRAQYVQHIVNVLKLMGEPEAQASSDAQKVMQLETAWPRPPWMSHPAAIPAASIT
jgi:putative endopeptidase